MALLEELAEAMGGDEDVEYFDIDVTVGKGGRVVVSGLASETINGFSSKTQQTIEDVYYDETSSLTFRIQVQNGYSLKL